MKTEFKEESILGKRDHWGVPDPVKLPRIVVVKTSKMIQDTFLKPHNTQWYVFRPKKKQKIS